MAVRVLDHCGTGPFLAVLQAEVDRERERDHERRRAKQKAGPQGPLPYAAGLACTILTRLVQAAPQRTAQIGAEALPILMALLRAYDLTTSIEVFVCLRVLSECPDLRPPMGDAGLRQYVTRALQSFPETPALVLDCGSILVNLYGLRDDPDLQPITQYLDLVSELCTVE